MNWFAEQRQEWIGEMLRIYGFINRFHMSRKFGISNAQAALDFKAFHEANPEAMKYDARKKVYFASDAPKASIDKL
jgi:hypothetical protein